MPKVASQTQRQMTSTLLPVSGILQRKCACGNQTVAGGECEECSNKRTNLQRRGVNNQSEHSEVPPIVHEVLRSPGQPLDVVTRTFMEQRFGHEFSGVRIHADGKAAESAWAVNALAYTVGRDVVFGTGRYSPGATAGRSLLAHELAHVVQQSQGPGPEAEPRAEAAAERVVRGELVAPEMVGGAPPGLHAQNDDKREPPRTPTTEPAFSLSWDQVAQPGRFQLQPPTLTLPSPQPPTLGGSVLTPPSVLVPPLSPPTLQPTSGSPAPIPPGLAPPFTPPSPTSAGTPALPSRLPVLSSGQFSLGLTLGFPEAEAAKIPGAPDSALQESLRRAEVMNQILTGTVPTGWEAIDKAKLAQAAWGIFSTHLAPDLARKITSGLSTPTGPGRTSFELDLVLLTDFSGGGLSFTVRH